MCHRICSHHSRPKAGIKTKASQRLVLMPKQGNISPVRRLSSVRCSIAAVKEEAAEKAVAPTAAVLARQACKGSPHERSSSDPPKEESESHREVAAPTTVGAAAVWAWGTHMAHEGIHRIHFHNLQETATANSSEGHESVGTDRSTRGELHSPTTQGLRQEGVNEGDSLRRNRSTGFHSSSKEEQGERTGGGAPVDPRNNSRQRQQQRLELLPSTSPLEVISAAYIACGRRFCALALSDGRLATFGFGGEEQLHLDRDMHGGTKDYGGVVRHHLNEGDHATCEHRHDKEMEKGQNFLKSGARRIRRQTWPGQAGRYTPSRNRHHSGPAVGTLSGIALTRGQTTKPERRYFASLRVYPRLQTDIRVVSCGSSHAAAVDYSGAVWTWGASAAGALGLGTRSSSSSPQKVSECDQETTGDGK